MDLFIKTVGSIEYHYANVTNVRASQRELRWTNARGEKSRMALAFIEEWQAVETPPSRP